MKHLYFLHKSTKLFIEIAFFLFFLVLDFSALSQPIISSFSPKLGTTNTTVTITGINFNSLVSNNVVFFGAMKADVISSSSTSLTVTVPIGATNNPISVTDITTGLTNLTSEPFIVTFCGGDINSTTLSSAMNLMTGTAGPNSVTIGDYDLDGRVDIATVNYGSNTLSVFRNIGVHENISFSSRIDLGLGGGSPIFVSTNDIDGDGKLDIVVVVNNFNVVSVYRNTSISGTISFAPKIDFNTSNSPRGISISDLNGDGKLDLVVANSATNTVSILKNTSVIGTLSFATKVDYTTGNSPQSVSTNDLNGDGKLDIAITNSLSNTISILRNTGSNGTISFATKVDYATGTTPMSISIDDFNGDGKSDISVANKGSNNISILRNITNNNILSFAAKVDFLTGLAPINISTGDLNGDGNIDITIANNNSNTVSVLKNTSVGGVISFSSKVDFTAGTTPSAVSIGDIDMDGKIDVIVGNVGSKTVSLLNNKNLTCIPTITNFTPSSGSIGTTITITGTNFNNIPANNIVYFGGAKAIVTAGNDSTLTVNVPIGASYKPITVMDLSTGLSGYSLNNFIVMFCGGQINATSLDTKIDFITGSGTTTPHEISMGDFDRDGNLDLSVLNSNINQLKVLRNTSLNNNFNFQLANAFSANTTTGPVDQSKGDFDGDGNLDVVVLNGYSLNGAYFFSIFRNNSSSSVISFEGKRDFSIGGSPGKLTTGDFDGDGKLDIAITTSSAISIFRNGSYSGNISFYPKVDIPCNGAPLITGDYDGDGKLDLVNANQASNTISLIKNSSSIGNISFLPQVDFITGSQPCSISTGDYNGDGKLDISITNCGSNTVSLLKNISNNGNISFAPKVDFITGIYPRSLSTDDLDGDGKLDFVVANYNSNTISLFKNISSNGNISFSPKVDFTTGTAPWDVSIGDLNGDGKHDLAVSNTGGTSNTLSLFKNLITAPPPIVSINTTGNNICAGTSITLAGQGANTYLWSGGVVDNTPFFPTETTTYSVTGTDTQLGCTSTASVTVTVNALPTATVTAGGATTFCQGNSVVLNANTGTGLTYQWKNNGTNITGATSASYTSSAAGFYTVVVTNSNGCSATSSATSVIVNALPTVNAGIDQSICLGQITTLFASGANTYAWNNNVTNNVAFTPTSTNTYAVIGTDANGCQNSDSIQITVNSLPVVNAGIDQTICQGHMVTIAANGANTYSWNNSVTNNVAFAPTSTNTYIVTGTDVNGCQNSDSIQITVNSLPVVNAGIDQTICQGQTATLSASGANSYSWNNNVTNNVSFTPTASNNYVVTGTDVNGCQDSDTIQVTVNPTSTSQLTQTAVSSYTLNGQAYTQSGTYTQVLQNAYGCDSTITLNLNISSSGINELNSEIISIYPNPASSLIHIDYNGKIDKLEILDLKGSVVFVSKENKREFSLPTHLQTGYYMVVIHDEKQLFRKELLIQR